jgi:hypothetical protein
MIHARVGPGDGAHARVPLWRARKMTLPVTWVTGLTCGSSGLLQGCDQGSFTVFSIYLDFQAKSQVRWGFTEMWRTG